MGEWSIIYIVALHDSEEYNIPLGIYSVISDVAEWDVIYRMENC